MGHRATLIALLLAVACSWSLVVPAQEAASDDDEAKGFWVEEEAMDLGTVTAGKDAVAVFTFHNDTDQEVRILRAKPS